MTNGDFMDWKTFGRYSERYHLGISNWQIYSLRNIIIGCDYLEHVYDTQRANIKQTRTYSSHVQITELARLIVNGYGSEYM
jgi:hypothetical protein